MNNTLESENKYCAYANKIRDNIKDLMIMNEEDLLINLAHLVQEAQYDDVITVAKAKELIDCNNIKILNILHYAYFRTGNVAAAIDICNKVLKIDSKNEYALYGAALCYASIGNRDKVNEILNSADFTGEKYIEIDNDIKRIMENIK